MQVIGFFFIFAPEYDELSTIITIANKVESMKRLCLLFISSVMMTATALAQKDIPLVYKVENTGANKGHKTKWLWRWRGGKRRKAFIYRGFGRLRGERPEKRNGLQCFTTALHRELGKWVF